MDEKLQKLLYAVCSGFPTRDVRVCNIFDQRRLVRMAHYAWKNNIGFHPDMFKCAMKNIELFQSLSEEELDSKAEYLCLQADSAKSVFHVAFDLEHLSI